MRPIAAHKNCSFCYLFSLQYFVWFCTYPSTALQIRLEIAGSKTHFSWLDSAISPCNVHQEEQDLSVSPSSMKKKNIARGKWVFLVYIALYHLCFIFTRQPNWFLSMNLHRIFRVCGMDVQTMTFLTPARPEELSVIFFSSPVTCILVHTDCR